MNKYTDYKTQELHDLIEYGLKAEKELRDRDSIFAANAVSENVAAMLLELDNRYSQI